LVKKEKNRTVLGTAAWWVKKLDAPESLKFATVYRNSVESLECLTLRQTLQTFYGISIDLANFKQKRLFYPQFFFKIRFLASNLAFLTDSFRQNDLVTVIHNQKFWVSNCRPVALFFAKTLLLGHILRKRC